MATSDNRNKAKRWASTIAWFFLAFSIVVLAAEVLVVRSYRQRAQLVQLVQADASDALFGGAGITKIGSPVKRIIDDPKAFLEGHDKNGARYVDAGYLAKHGVTDPLQLKTVNFIGSAIRYVMLALLLVSALVAYLARKQPVPST